MLTKTQVKVIMILLDDGGHAGWDIAKQLGEKKEESNLSPILKKLESMGIIYQGEPRKSRKQQKRSGDYKEFPYYLKMSLETIKNVIRELIETNLRETWFIFKIIAGSNYLASMREKFEDDIDIAIEDELRKSPIFSDDFYKSLLKGSVHFEEALPDPEKDEIRSWWYFNR